MECSEDEKRRKKEKSETGTEKILFEIFRTVLFVNLRRSSEDLKIEKPDDLQSRMAYLAENRTYETDRDIAMVNFFI